MLSGMLSSSVLSMFLSFSSACCPRIISVMLLDTPKVPMMRPCLSRSGSFEVSTQDSPPSGWLSFSMKRSRPSPLARILISSSRFLRALSSSRNSASVFPIMSDAAIPEYSASALFTWMNFESLSLK